MQVYTTLFLLLSTALLPVDKVTGCIPKENRKGRRLDGSLKCYQCTSGTSPKDGCRLSNWKHANRTERRFMEMQCPRRSSAFCLLKTWLDDPDRVERGCFKSQLVGPDRKKETAHLGCFHMGDTHKVCLCRENLCNAATATATAVPWPPLLAAFLASAVTLLYPWFYSKT